MVDQAIGACADVDLILFLVEAQTALGPGDEYILNLFEKMSVPVFLVINKIDLVEPPKLLGADQFLCRAFRICRSCSDFSSLRRWGRKNPRLVEARLDEGPQYYAGDELTDLPERFIAAELIREKIMRRTNEEIPYGVGVKVESFEEQPEKNLVVIQATIHVERDSHKKIIVGKGGQMIKKIGQEARQDIERMLATRVFLELFVRVDKDWSQSERMLRELGYSQN